MKLPASYGRFEQEYCILRELGSGGEGKVYLVRHQVTEQLRAAKRLWKGTDADRLHELKMMKRLRHPSLPEVIDVLPEKDCIWLIMTYVKGQCLKELFGGGISETEFFSIAGQLSEVLGYLHGRRMPILHLDIKPTNLLLKRNGRLVLIDFGAALQGQPGIRPEQCCGTPGFAAPEQYQKGSYLDARTDVYGAGAVLYYLLSGTIAGGGPEAMRTAAEQSIRKDSWKKAAYTLVENCMKKEPSERYADGAQLTLAIREFQKKCVGKRRMRDLLGVLILVLVFGLFCVGTLKREQGTSADRRAQEYALLLEQAERGGIAQAGNCYRNAAELYPEKEELYTHFVNRMLQDCRMDQEEERLLQELLYAPASGGEQTVKEALARDRNTYGRLAYQIGLLYWYFYENSGGKTAASNWFQEAVQSAQEMEEVPDWLQAARIYQRISGYYERIGKENPLGEGADYGTLFRDLSALWTEIQFQSTDAGIRVQAAKELLACMIMAASRLQQDGMTKAELSEIIEEIQDLSEEQVLSKEQKEELQRQCKAACASVERTYHGKQAEGGVVDEMEARMEWAAD